MNNIIIQLTNCFRAPKSKRKRMVRLESRYSVRTIDIYIRNQWNTSDTFSRGDSSRHLAQLFFNSRLSLLLHRQQWMYNVRRIKYFVTYFYKYITTCRRNYTSWYFSHNPSVGVPLLGNFKDLFLSVIEIGYSDKTGGYEL